MPEPPNQDETTAAHVPESGPPSLQAIRDARARLGAWVLETPLLNWSGHRKDALVGPATHVLMKLELFQHAGSFKPRGALLNMLDLSQQALRRGVTAVSAGNHAMAVGYAARTLGTHAKVVMPENADAVRMAGCRAWGAEVVTAPTVHAAFAEAERLESEEGRAFVHPFEGPNVVLGTATLGLEICEQAGDLDALIVPIGGGGLCAGVASAVKQLQPRCLLFGVEPTGADTMHRSFRAGRPASIDTVRTIADSLGAPHAAPYTFALCRELVDELVLIEDDEIRAAMRLLMEEMKLAVEPAGAAATAALLGPLRARLAGLRVGLIVCGSNIAPEVFWSHVRNAPSFD